jgi:hypothetical protein
MDARHVHGSVVHEANAGEKMSDKPSKKFRAAAADLNRVNPCMAPCTTLRQAIEHSKQIFCSKTHGILYLAGQQVAHVTVFRVCRHAAHHVAGVDVAASGV